MNTRQYRIGIIHFISGCCNILLAVLNVIVWVGGGGKSGSGGADGASSSKEGGGG